MLRKFAALMLVAALYGTASAQTAPTATPPIINLRTDVPLQQEQGVPTSTWTPTPAAPAVAQVSDQVNVRAEPSTNASILGVIRPGESYNITGQWFEWVQIQFVASPNGRGWVFGQLVDIVGDAASIPQIDLNAQPTLDPTVIGATETQEIITLTPGGLLTATAQARQLNVPGSSGVNGLESGGGVVPGAPLPTFTYPPGIVMQPTQAVLVEEVPPQRLTTDPIVATEFPPIVPILLLGALGILGLVIGSFRRG